MWPQRRKHVTDIAEVNTSAADEQSAGRKRKGTGLDSMVLPELKQLANSLGLRGTAAMRKGQLIEAIRGAQNGTSRPSGERAGSENGAGAPAAVASPPAPAQPSLEQPSLEQPSLHQAVDAPRSTDNGHRVATESRESRDQNRDGQGREDQSRGDQSRGDQSRGDQSRGDQSRGDQNRGDQNRGDQNRGDQNRDQRRDQDRDQGRGQQNRDQNQRDQNQRDYDDDGGGRRGRRRRSRDRQNRRNRNGGGALERFEAEPTVAEDDVLVPVAGILDVLDNYAFVRTSGYLPGSNDAYVSLSMVKKSGLRKGDAVTGAIRSPRDGERKEKFNPLVRIDSVNGSDLEPSRPRPEFGKLTPLYPQERLKLETTPAQLTGRIIDLISPIGKGQRALLVSPSKAGKTMIMQQIANAISTNNPEVKLMVVLVDERPEEVTDFERAVKGEVISSTFDRPAEDHTTVAELAIERAKRLVELGHDVVVLLDGITRLSRAYNLAAPASGRILSGGVDSAALYPPKKFLGAARNIEGGGSLTIIATALIETGSKMDEVIFEEFKGTGNSEIRLRREFAEKRIFPAIDVDASSTRREELLMSREELNIVWKLRRVLSGLESLQGLEMLLDRLRKTSSNGEFLMAITKTIPGRGEDL
jgi:transcription termination factor Rho